MALASSISDNFDDGTMSALWTQTTAGGTLSESSGTLNIAMSGAGFGYSGYLSVLTYDITGDAVYVKVPTAANNVAGAESQFALNIDGTAEMSMVKGGASLVCRYRIGSVNNDTYPTYNATNHLWWRIREASGSIYYDASPDGTTWTNLRTQAHTYTNTQLQSCSIWLRGGQYQAVAGPGNTVYDNFNTTGATAATPNKLLLLGVG